MQVRRNIAWRWSSAPSSSTSSAPTWAPTLANPSPRVPRRAPVSTQRPSLVTNPNCRLRAATTRLPRWSSSLVASALYARRHAGQDRYRIDPTPSQRQALARAFGCARVVYNDALAERQRAFAAGEKLSDSEIQRRVVTWPRSPRSGRGWPRSHRWCWCRPARTRGVPTATGSTRARASATAAASAARGSGPSTAASRSGSPATALPCTGP